MGTLAGACTEKERHLGIACPPFPLLGQVIFGGVAGSIGLLLKEHLVEVILEPLVD